jgi:hypothetical protein
MRVKWKRMICGRPALIVIQMQRGEKAVMFRQMAKHARLMTTSRYIERTAPHRKSRVNALKVSKQVALVVGQFAHSIVVQSANQICDLSRLKLFRVYSAGPPPGARAGS